MSDEIIRCVRCIVPASLPSSNIDKKGVCSFCRRFDSLFGKDSDNSQKRRAELEAIFAKAKKLKKPYDCLVPLSGGKIAHMSFICAIRFMVLNVFV